MASWDYLDLDAPEVPVVEAPLPGGLLEQPPTLPSISEEEVAIRVQEALRQAKSAWEAQAAEQQQARDARLLEELSRFGAKRSAYFKQMEHEVVQLALAIARKVLHREAALDPTLLVGLVRVALDRMSAEPPIRLRVPSAALNDWQLACAAVPSLPPHELAGDAGLEPGDCIVETTLGSASFGIEAQLKEMEGAFLDLLAKRPDTR